MKRVGKEISKALWSLDPFQGVARSSIRQIIHDELREKIFSPHRILKFMDLSSGSLNYAAIEILRSIENLVGHKWFRGIIPSPTTIRKAAKAVEAKADEIGLKTRKILTPQGEGVEFLDKAKVIQLIHDAYGLTDVVGKERPLEVAITTDGSMLCHLVNLVMVGYKM
eukprot:scaffold97706_cov59-Attheya_sp.AAC.1